MCPRNKVQGYHWEISENLALMVEKVKHIYREHNQVADHWSDIGAQGRRKIDFYRKDAPTTWKAIRGFWDGMFKADGRSGCGIVIKGVDRANWVAISKIAVH